MRGSSRLDPANIAILLDHGAAAVTWSPELYVRSADQIADPLEALGTFTYALDFRGGLAEAITPAKPTFNVGYRHTLPGSIGNLAVLAPSAGWGGLGEGTGRIIELNIPVGQGVATAAALVVRRQQPLGAIDPREVARRMPAGYAPDGRPCGTTIWHLRLPWLAGSPCRTLQLWPRATIVRSSLASTAPTGMPPSCQLCSASARAAAISRVLML